LRDRSGRDANGLVNSSACSQGISGVQVPFSLHLTTSNAPVRDSKNTVKTTSAFFARCLYCLFAPKTEDERKENKSKKV
jgi:hypothetical protein